MPKINQTPGTALHALLKKHNLNYNRLAKAIGISNAMVRLIARDENPVSASIAFRLARFFKTKPEYWLALQMEFEISTTAQDKKLAKSLKEIPTVDKAVFTRKPKTVKAKEPAKKTAAKSGKTAKPAAKKAAKPAAGKRGRPAGKAAAKTAKAAKPAAKKTVLVKTAAVKARVSKTAVAKTATGKRGRPPAAKPSQPPKKRLIVKVKPEPKPTREPVVQPAVQDIPPVFFPETPINEPQI